MITVTTNGLTNLVFEQGPPPIQTEATGVAEITPGVDSIAYSMIATNIVGVTAGHIHLGAKGENGPIVVTLFKYDSPMNEVSKMAQLRLINSKDQ